MSAGQYDITIEQGATFKLPLTFTENGTALDVSGWTFRGQVRPNYSSSTVIATFVITFGPGTNQIALNITAANTGLIPVQPTSTFPIIPTIYCYDIIAILPTNAILRILEGAASIVPTVTR